MTTFKEIAAWWEEGKSEGAAFLIVVCDTFDHEDYPVWIAPGEDFYAKYDHYNGQNMQRVMEVYDYSKPWPEQAKGRAFNLPPRSAPPIQENSMDNSRMKDWVNGQPLPDSESQLREARELLLHFQFIAHGPGCDCEWCMKRAFFLERTKPAVNPRGPPK